MKLVQDAEIKNKKVFLRVDFNVPVKDGEITDTNRIRAALPTIKYLAESRASVIIGTHLGRPEGKPSGETSVEPIAKELQKMLNLKVLMAPGVTDPQTVKMAENLRPGEILLLENLRWDKREEENDALFAEKMAGYADLYVNDAFAVSHRANASVEAITRYLPSYAGLLLQAEVEHLTSLMEKPKSPFVVVIGGVKVKDKAGMIDKLASKVDKFLIGGGVANTFLKASGTEISHSVCDDEMVSACHKMLEKYGDKIVLPVDFVTAEDEDGFKIFDLGKETIEQYREILSKAVTVLWNGNLGYTEEAKYRAGSRAIAEVVSRLGKMTVLAGGDTVGFVKQEKLDKGFAFISTGGGAALEFLAGEKLPGIKALG